MVPVIYGNKIRVSELRILCPSLCTFTEDKCLRSTERNKRLQRSREERRMENEMTCQRDFSDTNVTRVEMVPVYPLWIFQETSLKNDSVTLLCRVNVFVTYHDTVSFKEGFQTLKLVSCIYFYDRKSHDNLKNSQFK